MDFKRFFFKKIVPTYFMIVTFINLATGVFGSILYPRSVFGYPAFLAPLVLGAAGCVPQVVEYLLGRYLFRGRPQSMGANLLEALGELALLELCIVGGSELLMGFDTLSTAAVMAIMVLAIFAAVTAIQYVQDNKICTEMNRALESMRR